MTHQQQSATLLVLPKIKNKNSQSTAIVFHTVSEDIDKKWHTKGIQSKHTFWIYINQYMNKSIIQYDFCSVDMTSQIIFWSFL